MIRKHTKRRGAVSLAVAFLLVLVLFVAHARGFLNGPESVLQRVLSPVLRVMTSIENGVSTRAERFASLWGADERLRAQEADLARLEAEIERLHGVEAENVRLSEELKLSPKPALPAVRAQIIAVNPTVTNTLLLDAGTEAGVRIDAPVIVNGALFGYITDVGLRTSQLRLLTDPKSVVQATVPDAKVRGALFGTIGQRDLILREIPRGVVLVPGMSVLAAGREEAPHPLLIVGTVSEVEDDVKSPTLSVRVRPITRPRDVEDVLILRL